jgi:ABC-type uncharacterized transport system substrate-binding protein
VDHNVDVIVTASTPGTLAAKRATAKIPIVFAASTQPSDRLAFKRASLGSLCGRNETGFLQRADDC